MNSNREIAELQLTAIASLSALLGAENMDYWLIGGWAVDFHAGKVTRDHHDIDIAVWVADMPRLRDLLVRKGWIHSPKQDEDGGTGYQRGAVRLELTYLARSANGDVYTPLRNGATKWQHDALRDDVRSLRSVKSRVVRLASLTHSKSTPRTGDADASKDRADLEVLLKLTPNRER